MPAQIVKLEMAMRDGYDVIADQRAALCKAGTTLGSAKELWVSHLPVTAQCICEV
jgi:hypothetical protein